MNKLSSLLLVIIVLALVPGQAALAEDPPPYTVYQAMVLNQLGPVVTHLGPNLGRTLGVVQDPFQAHILYTFTAGSGVYKSTDYGQSWFFSSKGMSYLVLQSLAADPKNPGVLYAGTYGDLTAPFNGVYKSTDYGATWAQTGEMGNTWNGQYYKNPVVYAIEVDPTNPQRIFAGTRMKDLPDGALGGGGVFRSENGGQSWTPVNNDLPDDKLYVYDLELNPAIPGTVYVTLHGIQAGGVYMSSDNGGNWTQIMGREDALDGRALLVDPYDSGLLYYGAATFQGFWRDIIAENNWRRTSGDWHVNIGAISADPYHQGRVFAGVCQRYQDTQGCSMGLARSTDSGQNWEMIDTESVSYEMAFSPDQHTSFVAYDWEGVYKSTDGGLNWSPSTNQLTGFSVTGLAQDVANPGLLLAALYGGGMKISENGGGSWADVSPGLDNRNVLGVLRDPAHPDIVYAFTDYSGVYRSQNGGRSWNAYNNGYPPALAGLAALETQEPSPYDNRPLPERDEFVYAGQQDEPNVTLQNASAGLASANFMAYSPFTGDVLIGTNGRGLYRLPSTPDAVWTVTGLSGGSVYSLVIDSANPGRLLAGVDSGSGSLLASTNNGLTWQYSNSGLAGRKVLSLAQSHLNPQILLAGTDDGVYASNNGGAAWSPAGLTGQAITAVAVQSSAGGALYLAGSSANLYYSSDLTGMWAVVDPAFEGVGVQGLLRDLSRQAFYVTTRFGGILQVNHR